jgi:hypothetical protein
MKFGGEAPILTLHPSERSRRVEVQVQKLHHILFQIRFAAGFHISAPMVVFSVQYGFRRQLNLEDP